MSNVTNLYPPVYKSPIEIFIDNWLISNNAKLNIKTDLVKANGITYDQSTLIGELFIQSQRHSHVKGGERLIKHIVIKWWNAERIKERQLCISTVCDSVSDETDLRKFIKAICKDDYKLNLAVMKHFIWQVKRKMNNLPVYEHLMPVLFGKTGGGKSVAVLKLLDVIEPVVKSNLTFADIMDDRKNRIFEENFVLFFDEMSHAEKANVDLLKNRITAVDVPIRLMGTLSNPQIPNNATFIGCSNKQIIDLIYDTTSARRFAQIDCLDKFDRDMINSIDYLKIWQCVSHTENAPILPFLDQIKEKQSSLMRNKSPSEVFIEDCCVVDEDIRSSGETLWDNFKIFCSSNNVNGGNKVKFLRELSTYRQKTNGLNKYKVRIKTPEEFGEDLPSWIIIGGGK